MNDIENKNSENGNGVSSSRTILLVNTGSIKKRFILQRLKKLGLQVVCLNKEKNWAQPYIDHWIIADNSDHSQSLHAIKEFIIANPQIKISGVLTFWEDDVLLTSKICDKFKFIGIPFSSAKKVRNKYLFREFCREHGIPAPRHAMINSEKDLEKIAIDLQFPMVIKPAFGSSSAYVIKVENTQELQETYRYIKENISISAESSLVDGLEILIEEYIDGDEVDIDILIQNGKIKFLSISDNYDKARGSFFVDSGQAIPSSLPAKDQENLINLVDETLEKIGIQNGCIHFEAKSTKLGPCPIEVNLRMGGDYVYSYTKTAWGVDMIDYAVKIATGEYIKPISLQVPYKYIVGWDLHPEDSGILVELDVDDEIKRNKFIEEIHFYKQIGDPVLVPPEGYDYLGWITVSGDNILDAQTNLKLALNSINYKVVKFGQDSSLGKTLRKNRFSAAVLNKDLLLGAAKIEKVRRISRDDQKKLHIGIVGNLTENMGNVPITNFDIGGSAIVSVLKEKGYRVSYFDFNEIAKVLEKISKSDVDLFFNICEDINSEFVKLHSATSLNALRLPYIGSNPLTLGICSDKISVKKLLSFHNIPTPKWDYAYSLEEEIRDDLKYPLMVKPANTDHSIGIDNNSVVNNKEELRSQLKKIIDGLNRPALIEEYIDGDEYDVSILGNDEGNIRVLPLSRTIFKNLPPEYPHIYTYDAKWSNNPDYNNIVIQRPLKNISRKLEALITEIALDTYNILDCHDYGRVEIRVDANDNPYVLELNPNASISPLATLPSVARLVDLNYGDLLEEIINIAIQRYSRKPFNLVK